MWSFCLVFFHMLAKVDFALGRIITEVTLEWTQVGVYSCVSIEVFSTNSGIVATLAAVNGRRHLCNGLRKKCWSNEWFYSSVESRRDGFCRSPDRTVQIELRNSSHRHGATQRGDSFCRSPGRTLTTQRGHTERGQFLPMSCQNAHDSEGLRSDATDCDGLRTDCHRLPTDCDRPPTDCDRLRDGMPRLLSPLWPHMGFSAKRHHTRRQQWIGTPILQKCSVGLENDFQG